MGRYIIRRTLWMFVILFAVSIITFLLMHAIPGGPFDREKPLPAEIKANLNARYHLDDPLYLQYLTYIRDIAVPHLSDIQPGTTVLDDAMVNIPVGEGLWLKWMNFGPSYKSRSRTVNDIFKEQLAVSFQLGIMALCVAVAIGLPLGIMAALKQNTIVDYGGMSLAILGVSVPVIVLGPILVAIFAVVLKWFPPSGWGAQPPWIIGLFPREINLEYFRYACLPVFALGVGSAAVIARLSRASLLQVIREDYIRTARAKGLVDRLVITRHALKNSLIPVVTILGPLAAVLVTGTFVTELIFGLPGMGKYFVTSITNRDYPVIMGTILLYAIVLVFANLVVDVVYAWLDPRIRYT
jgi:ABC-type dipeptide/oligopeptide/nickel transport system permease component